MSPSFIYSWESIIAPRLTYVLLFSLTLWACKDDATQDTHPSDGQTLGMDGTVDMASAVPDMAQTDATNNPMDSAISGDGQPSDGAYDMTKAPDGPLGPPQEFDVQVLLDGEPTPNVLVVQGGTNLSWRTGDDGRVRVTLNVEVDGELRLVASHPEARVRSAEIYEGVPLPISISLMRFDPEDNEAYRFQDPGEPRRRNTTAQCGHCHITINRSWYESPHRTSAANPKVHDIYAGVAAARDTEADCESAGGHWRQGLEPGTGENIMRCYLGYGTLPDINEDCGDEDSCDDVATAYGHCADCHAPAIDGQLGGRDLLEARGFAYTYGVSCNVCHQVERVELDDAPGVAGRLRILRPSDPGSVTLGANGWLPLTFGPSHDSPNPRMGSVQRDHYRDATICAGCHQQHQPPLVPGAEIDRERWPDGRLPIQSTYEEWRTGPLGEATRCQSCHMPPDPLVSNGADKQDFPLATVGIQGGWLRPPGSVRQHSWLGPRQPRSRLLQLAAGLFVRPAPVMDGRVEVAVEVTNAGCGHAMPTGEALRSVVLKVDAFCNETPLDAVGGDAVPGFAGYASLKTTGSDWTRWPDAAVGDRIRVIERDGRWYDYDGFGSFGANGFSPEQKGMPVERVVGEVTIISLQEGVATFDAPLPRGTVAYRIASVSAHRVQAGQAGFAFARVMADANRQLMVPHHVAVDVVSDNRLLPQASWTTRHIFDSPCAEPQFKATLLYRAFPIYLSSERKWGTEDVVMVEVRR